MTRTGASHGRLHRALVVIARAVVETIVQLRAVGAHPRGPVRLCIEAGAREWELLEYREIERSAVERFGAGSVVRVVRAADEGYVRGVRPPSPPRDRPTTGWTRRRPHSRRTGDPSRASGPPSSSQGTGSRPSSG